MKTDAQKLDDLVRHIDNVRNNCLLLGKKLIEAGQPDMGRKLIALGYVHDQSKFHGVEWEYLDPTTTNRIGLKNAVLNHSRTNPHHPEYWGGIDKMPDIYIAEMVCDWKARSTEFANDLRNWIDTKSLKKFSYAKDSSTYKKIMGYVDMVCDKPFSEEPTPATETPATQPSEVIDLMAAGS
jgi:hypothetical protein